MLQAAWYGTRIKGESGWWKFELKLAEETIYLAVYRNKPWDDPAAELETFVKNHLSAMETVGVEDVELVVAKLKDLAGEGASVFIAVMRKTEVMYGVLGGEVWLSRGEKSGYLASKPATLAVGSGKLEEGDRLVLGLGKANLTELKPHEGVILAIRGYSSGEQVGETLQSRPKRSMSQAISAWFKPSPDPQVYIKNLERRRLGMLVLGLFGLLLISIILGWYKRQANMRAEAFAKVYEPALTLLIEAEKDSTANPLASRDKLQQARQLLTDQLANYDDKSSEAEKLTTLFDQVNELHQKISGEKVLEAAETYFDLTVVSEGVWGEKMAVGNGWVVVLDTAKGLVVGVELATKQAKILAGGELLKGAAFIAASTGKAVVSAEQGLVGVFYSDRKMELVKEKDESWSEIGALGMFGGNVYVATRVGDIWHYPGFDGGLGERRRWLGPGVVPNLTNLTAMTVDGDIWLTTKSVGILHFRRGAPMNVNLKGLAEPLGEIGSIYAEYEKEEFWVLDKTKMRLVAFGKDGTYKQQIQWQGLAGVSDMAVTTNKDGGGIILLLSGSTIYQIPL